MDDIMWMIFYNTHKRRQELQLRVDTRVPEILVILILIIYLFSYLFIYSNIVQHKQL